MSTPEIVQLHEAIGQLRRCVGSLRSHYGDSAGVRRLSNDIERLDIDAEEVTGQRTPIPRQAAAMTGDRVVISDTPYDPDLWRGADDEGVGGYHASE